MVALLTALRAAHHFFIRAEVAFRTAAELRPAFLADVSPTSLDGLRPGFAPRRLIDVTVGTASPNWASCFSNSWIFSQIAAALRSSAADSSLIERIPQS